MVGKKLQFGKELLLVRPYTCLQGMQNIMVLYSRRSELSSFSIYCLFGQLVYNQEISSLLCPPAATSCKEIKWRQATGRVSRWVTANLRSLIICRYSCKQHRPESEIRHRFLPLLVGGSCYRSSRSCQLCPTIRSEHMFSHCCEMSSCCLLDTL